MWAVEAERSDGITKIDDFLFIGVADGRDAGAELAFAGLDHRSFLGFPDHAAAAQAEKVAGDAGPD